MMVLQDVILPIVYVIVGAALVWALVELILFLRRTSKTVASVEEQVQPILADAKKMTEDLKPAVEKLDPLVDRVSLAVDAANLEMMRIDGILEDISAITDTTARTVDAVDTVAQTPMRLVTEASAKLRSAFGSKDASDTAAALASKNEADMAAALHDGSVQVADAGVPAPQAESAQKEPVYTQAAPASTADTNAVSAPAADGSTTPAPAEQATEAKPQSKYFTY